MVQIKRGKKKTWDSKSHSLVEGELGVVTNTGSLRVGDIGKNTWADAIRILPEGMWYNKFDPGTKVKESIAFVPTTYDPEQIQSNFPMLNIICDTKTTNGFGPGIRFYSDDRSTEGVNVLYGSSIKFDYNRIDFFPTIAGSDLNYKQVPALSIYSSKADSKAETSFIGIRIKGGDSTYPEDFNDTLFPKLIFEYKDNDSSWNHIRCNVDITPESDGVRTLGTPCRRWATVYAKDGIIQTSDRKSKTSIKKVKEISSIESSPGITGPEFEGQDAKDTSELTINKLVDFVKTIDPVTYRYRKLNGEADDEPSAVQLGLIADEIKDFDITLFSYIGDTDLASVPDPTKYELVTDKEDKNYLKFKKIDTNEYFNQVEIPMADIVKEERLGLKPLSVAVAALSVCKYLLSKIDSLENAIKNR